MRIYSLVSLLLFTFISIGQPLSTPVTDSFDLLNSPYDELNPVLSPDGKTLYVTIANHPDNIGGKKDPGDIWYAVLTENNQWSAPIHGGKLLNNRGFNGVAGFSTANGNMYLLSHYDASGSPRTQGIAVAKRSGNGWSAPENISIPYFQNKSETLGGYITPDESVFVFSAETYGTRGVEDLYVTVKGNDGKWMEPKNLGAVINTQFQELYPSLSDDGRTLYFSSNGRKGFGSFDIYASSRLDDTWTNWSEPVNMGPTINTEGRDLFYRDYHAQDFALYTSTKNSDGYGDVKLYRRNNPPANPTDTATTTASVGNVIPVQPVTETPVPDKSVRIYGKVLNAKTNEFIPAKITFVHASDNQATTSTTHAGYTVTVPSIHDYIVKIEATGYISSLEKLSITTYEMKELEMNFKLQPVEIGTTVNLKNVLFEQGKTNLLPESFDELDMVISFLKSNPNVKIELAGHTDNRGIPTQNVKLSQARVDKVKDYLTGKGIDKKRISGKGYGGAIPIASNDNEETRQLNRRVEFIIKKL
ncbi:MAG TPA: OmpA family protein [Ohtaekwangia sp.]|uniref:OmpA family protein n=1 Tax=Ohtaekwangia sp. TaxID=2066019 RepID=UPI002F95C9BC